MAKAFIDFPESNQTTKKHYAFICLKFLFSIFLIFCYPQAKAQKQGQPLLDSLLKVLPNYKDDTNKAILLGRIAKLYGEIDIKQLFKYTNLELELAEKLQYKWGVGNAYNKLCQYYRFNGETEKAITYQEKAINIQQEIKDFTGLAISYENIGLVYFGDGKYPEALNYLNEALKIADNNHDLKRKADILLSIGNVYALEGISPEALKYYFSALKINEDINFKSGIADCNNNIGRVDIINNNFDDALKYLNVALNTYQEIGYKTGIADCFSNIGDIYNNKGIDSLAMKYYNKELNIANESGNREKILDAYISLGQLYEKEGKFGLALCDYDTAQRLAEVIDDKTDVAAMNVHIGNIYLLQKKLNDAEIFNSKGLKLSQEIGFLDGIKEADSNLSAVYELTGRYKDALESYRKHIKLRDSMFNKENTRKNVQFQMQYDFDKKETIEKKEEEKKEALAEQKIKKQKQLKYIFIGGFGVVFVFSMVVFRQRNRISKEKKRSEDLLLNILPEEVAHELKEKGSAEAKHFDNVTVLFTDFKGFTKLAEKMTPQQLVAELDTCFRGFDAIIHKYDLEKIKTIGDAYMAVAGLPTPNPDHAYLMVKAGIEIRDFIIDRKEKRGELGFDVRVGIHSGDVVAGIVGFKKFAYDIWGDTVNTASRMESSGEPGKVNISGTTYELVMGKFEFFYRGKLAAKNKGEMDMYFVENIS